INNVRKFLAENPHNRLIGPSCQIHSITRGKMQNLIVKNAAVPAILCTITITLKFAIYAANMTAGSGFLLKVMPTRETGVA
ncbi:MAG: hypothetical protein KGJ90_07125, partial [Patescibacteria group bacterium]|nr:hypothetical protein [Patescibacteria group bacterium]